MPNFQQTAFTNEFTNVFCNINGPYPSAQFNFIGSNTLDPRVTFTRASVANYFDSTGALTSAATDVPRFDFDPATARTNLVRNSVAAGGSTSVAPTNWSGAGPSVTAGITRTGVGPATIAGISGYIYEFNGTTTGNSGVAISTETVSGIPATSGQQFTVSFQLAFVSGTVTGGNYNVNVRIEGTNGATRTEILTSTDIKASLTTSPAQFSSTATLANAGTTNVRNVLEVNWVTGVTFTNYRVFIAQPQIEIGATATAYIPTTSAAVTRCDSRGLLVEGARTNTALWNRDLTNAAWVKTSVTATLNQTGLDNVANTASSITATAANGTVLQTVTLASSQRFMSAYVRRLVGTGTINMTTDNGVTWTPITVTSAWTRVSIPAQTVTNPVFGFQIVTSGDSIAVDFVQNEDGAFASSAITTTTAAVTRAADAPVINTIASVGYSTLEGSIAAIFELMGVGGTQRLFQASDGTGNNRVGVNANQFTVANGGVNQANLTGTAATAFVVSKVAAAYRLDDFAVSVNGAAVLTDTLGTVPTAITRIGIGYDGYGPTSHTFGWLRSITYYPSRLANATLQSLAS